MAHDRPVVAREQTTGTPFANEIWMDQAFFLLTSDRAARNGKCKVLVDGSPRR
jgi:hypothetical protein